MKKEDFMKIVRSKAKETLTEQDVAMFEGIGEAIETAFSADSAERNKQLKAVTDKLGNIDEGETLAGIVRNLATALDALEAKTKRSLIADEKFKLRELLEAKRDDIQRARKGGNPWEIEFRAKRAASALMTTATVVTGATAINNPNMFEDMDVVVIQYPKNFILDAITSRLVSKVPAVWRWKEQKAASDGVPAATNEGATKPLTDKAFSYVSADRVKYAGRIEMTEEVEIDFEQLVIDIINMFETDVLQAWHDGVLAAIIAYASAYTTTALDGTMPSPDIYGVIMAGMAWVQSRKYNPDIVGINPVDLWLTRSTQDNNGNYKMNPFGPGDNFAGLQLFVSTGIEAGKILIGTRQTIQEQHSNFIIRKGVYGTQFIENESTIVGEIFSVLKTPVVSKASWLYLDISDTIDALQKA